MKPIFLFVLASLIAGPQCAWSAPLYRMVDLGSLYGSSPDGGPYDRALDINARGDVVGTSSPYDLNHGQFFVHRDGAMQALPTAPDFYGAGAAINGSGTIAGYELGHRATTTVLYRDDAVTRFPGYSPTDIDDAGRIVANAEVPGPFGTYSMHAFLYEGGAWTDLTKLRGIQDVAAINARGEIAGRTGNSFAVLSGGHMNLLAGLGGAYAFAHDLNASGALVGDASRADGSISAILHADGNIVDIGALLGAAVSSALGLNERGDVIGCASGNPFGYGSCDTAFLYSGGDVYDLDELLIPDASPERWHIAGVGDINDLGQIAATACDAGMTTCRAVRLDPFEVPEPVSLLLGALPAGAALWMAARRRRDSCGTPRVTSINQNITGDKT